MQRTVIIIGGGASGLAAAIAAARAGAQVTVLEAGQRVGAKILRTGNGRCNLTNRDISPDDYNDPEFVTPVLERWGSEEILGFFEELGLLVHEDSSGRIFPLSDNATSVLDVLRFECAHLGVEVLCCKHVVDIERLRPSPRPGAIIASSCVPGTGLDTRRTPSSWPVVMMHPWRRSAGCGVASSVRCSAVCDASAGRSGVSRACVPRWESPC